MLELLARMSAELSWVIFLQFTTIFPNLQTSYDVWSLLITTLLMSLPSSN